MTVRLAGEVDLALHRVELAIEDAVAGEEGVDILIDVDAVTFLDSTGLRVLVAAHARCAGDGRSLTLVNPSIAVSRILEITGLGKPSWLTVEAPVAVTRTRRIDASSPVPGSVELP